MSNKFPSTRFLGSKVKLLSWIHSKIKHLEFDSVLDVFGGTASFSYLMKTSGKKVYYNDILTFNKINALAIIENSHIKVEDSLTREVLRKKDDFTYKNIVQKNFRNIYYKAHENIWLDIVLQNILKVKNEYKKAILLSALYQSCLIKRPFNLFHRNNLKLRLRNVERKFGNKTTWETSFRKHFLKFIKEYNQSIFDNGRKNIILGGLDVLKIPNKKYDLVYLDPPYMSKKSKINYKDFYHFLEGLTNYHNWENEIVYESINKKLKKDEEVEKWGDKNRIVSLFDEMIKKYKNSIIVLSYRNDGIPSKKQIKEIFIKYKGKAPKIFEKKYKYALSNGSTKELLFISE